MIVKLAVLSDLAFTETEVPNSKSFVAGTEKYYVELRQEIDVEAERTKNQKELEYYRGFVRSIEGKLSNERFVAGAPAQVVENERKKLADGQARIQILEEMLRRL
jgi:valyl-tRNA synthetase